MNPDRRAGVVAFPLTVKVSTGSRSYRRGHSSEQEGMTVDFASVSCDGSPR